MTDVNNTLPTEELENPIPRVLAGLQEGRIVNYTMIDGSIRPLLVIVAGLRTGTINGILFFDPELDRGNHPVPLIADHSGFAPYCVRPLARVPFSEGVYGEAHTPGTWHWPTKQPVIAAAVSSEALNTPIDAIVSRFSEVFNKQVEVMNEMVNAKLANAIEHVNKMLDGHSDTILTLLAPAEKTAPEAGTVGESLGTSSNAGNDSEPAKPESGS